MTSLGSYAFESCTTLKSVTIPNTVTTIGYSTFESCIALKSFILPDNVTHIGYHAFDGCTSLTDITIGIGLTSMLNYFWLAKNFSDCPNLTSIYLRGNAPYFVWNPTNQIAHPTAYYLPGASLSHVSGLPTALWLAKIQSSNPSFGFHANQFGFTINWFSGGIVEVDACTNLAQAAWAPVATIATNNRSFYFSDPQWTNYPSRFYRVVGAIGNGQY